MRQIILYPGEDGFWIAECPSLKGCISQGSTKEEAIMNIKEAIQLYIDCLVEDNIPIPKENYELMAMEGCGLNHLPSNFTSFSKSDGSSLISHPAP